MYLPLWSRHTIAHGYNLCIRCFETPFPTYHVPMMITCPRMRQTIPGHRIRCPSHCPLIALYNLLQLVMLLGVVGIHQHRLSYLQDLLADLLSRLLNRGVGGQACLEDDGLGLGHSINSKQLRFEDWRRIVLAQGAKPTWGEQGGYVLSVDPAGIGPIDRWP